MTARSTSWSRSMSMPVSISMGTIVAVAQKELLEASRDVRAVFSAICYALMGPAVVGLVSIATASRASGAAAASVANAAGAAGIASAAGAAGAGAVAAANAADAAASADASRLVLIGMMSVFTLVSVFVGGMSLAMDAVAGERERRSLLPLLMNPVTRFEVLAGKWLAVSTFSIPGLLLNLCGFAIVFAHAGFALPSAGAASASAAASTPVLAAASVATTAVAAPSAAAAATLVQSAWAPIWTLAVLVVCGFGPLALFAAAVEIGVSTMCRSVKEAHTWLALLAFAPMGVGMFLVFFPRAAAGPLARLAPMAGQQLQWSRWLRDGLHDPWQTLALGAITLVATGLILLGVARLLERDDVVYGQ